MHTTDILLICYSHDSILISPGFLWKQRSYLEKNMRNLVNGTVKGPRDLRKFLGTRLQVNLVRVFFTNE